MMEQRGEKQAARNPARSKGKWGDREQEELDGMSFFKHVFTAQRLEKTTQKRGVNRQRLPSLGAGIWRSLSHALLGETDPVVTVYGETGSVSHIFKSISGLSEGAGLKVITAPLFPLINYMNNIWDNALLNIYV